MLHEITPLRPLRCAHTRCEVPASPQALSQLYVRYLELVKSGSLPQSMTFDEYYWVWRSSRRGQKFLGLDDGALQHGPASLKEMIDRPTRALKGVIKTKVLLVDFPDREHNPDRTTGYFEEMLFSTGTFPTGSMRDYYRKVSEFDADSGNGTTSRARSVDGSGCPSRSVSTPTVALAPAETSRAMPRVWRVTR